MNWTTNCCLTAKNNKQTNNKQIINKQQTKLELVVIKDNVHIVSNLSIFQNKINKKIYKKIRAVCSRTYFACLVYFGVIQMAR